MPVRVLPSDGLVFVIQRTAVSVPEAEEIVRGFLEVNRSGRAYLVVSDARGLAVPSAKVRQILGSAGTAESYEKNQGRASAVLLDSTLLRGALTSVSWFLSRTVMKPFESAADALPFLLRQAAEQGIDLTAADRDCLAALDVLWSKDKTSLMLPTPRVGAGR